MQAVDSIAAEFIAVESINGDPASKILLICDHATNTVPAELGSLGMEFDAFERHIAYDIGAAAATRLMAQALEAPAILSGFSRLLIDPNRGGDDPTLVMRISDGALIPGNAYIDAAEVERRKQLYWLPYRTAIADKIAAMTELCPAPLIISVHSMTHVWKGVERPWEFSILWDKDPRLAQPLIENLRAQRLHVGDNQPYDGALKGDTLYDHATKHGLAHVLIEFRQDLIADAEGVEKWTRILLSALIPLLENPELYTAKIYGSRADETANEAG